MKRFYSFLPLLLVAMLALTVAPWAQGQTFADTITPLTAAMCPGAPTAGTVTAATGVPAIGTGLMILTTPFAPVYQTSATNASGSTHTFTCDIPCAGIRTTLGKGCTAISGLAFFYGVQTTALTSENAPVCGTVTFPAPATSESASTVAFVSVPVTAVPVVGSANLGTTTAGAFFTQYVSITTPPALPSAAGVVYQKIFCTLSFAQSASSAQVVNTPGGIVFTTNTISWLRHHGEQDAIEQMAKAGISRSTAKLIYAHYHIPGFPPGFPPKKPKQISSFGDPKTPVPTPFPPCTGKSCTSGSGGVPPMSWSIGGPIVYSTARE